MNMLLSYKAKAEKVTLSFDRKAVLPTLPIDFSARSHKEAGKTFGLVCAIK
jgi:hypothetical protein